MLQAVLPLCPNKPSVFITFRPACPSGPNASGSKLHYNTAQITEISAGGAHSAAITELGRLYTWGKGRYFRLILNFEFFRLILNFEFLRLILNFEFFRLILNFKFFRLILNFKFFRLILNFELVGSGYWVVSV